MGINQDSSQEDESFISSDDGNNDGSSINWSEINSTDVINFDPHHYLLPDRIVL